MKDAIYNFLAGRVGAILVPILVGAVASFCAWATDKAPWLATYLTPANVVGFVLVASWALLSWLKANRNFKYGAQVQVVLNLIGKQFGLKIAEDGKVGPDTAAGAMKIAQAVSISPTEPVEVRRAIEVHPDITPEQIRKAANPKA